MKHCTWHINSLVFGSNGGIKRFRYEAVGDLATLCDCSAAFIDKVKKSQRSDEEERN